MRLKVNCLRGPVGFDHAAVILLANAKIEIHTEPETEGVEVRLAALNGRRALPFQETDLPGIDRFRVAEEIPPGLAGSLVGAVAEIRPN